MTIATSWVASERERYDKCDRSHYSFHHTRLR